MAFPYPQAGPGPSVPMLSLSIGASSGSVPQQEVTQFATVNLTFNLYDGDQCTFQVPASAPEVSYLDELASDVWLDGLIKQRYRVIGVDQAWGASGEDDVSVTAVSYKRLFGARFVKGAAGLTFTNVDQGQILWGLIAHTQGQAGGSWGVTAGSIPATVNRDRTYIEGDNIGDQMKQLQQVQGGPYWEIDWQKKLNVKALTAFTQLATPIQLGVNALGLQRQSAADRFANAVYVDGDNQTTTPVWAEASDVATDPRGRWETAESFATVQLQQTLVEHAQGLLTELHTPVATWQVVMDPLRWVGDSHFMPGNYAVLSVPSSLAALLPGAAPKGVIGQVADVGVSFTGDGGLEVKLAVVETGAVT